MDNKVVKSHLINLYKSISERNIEGLDKSIEGVYRYLVSYKKDKYDRYIQGALFHLFDRPGRNIDYENQDQEFMIENFNLEKNEYSIGSIFKDNMTGIESTIIESFFDIKRHKLPDSLKPTLYKIKEVVEYYNDVEYKSKIIWIYKDINEFTKLSKFTPEALLLDNELIKSSTVNKSSRSDKINSQNVKIPMISFTRPEILEQLFDELRGYFPNHEEELLKALKGGELETRILFPHNQNKLVEVFRRLKYNNFIVNNWSQIRDWLCANFQFLHKRDQTIRDLNHDTVYDNLTAKKGEVSKKEIICKTDWLPYKSPLQLKKKPIKTS